MGLKNYINFVDLQWGIGELLMGYIDPAGESPLLWKALSDNQSKFNQGRRIRIAVQTKEYICDSF